jgi:hypothetical protein
MDARRLDAVARALAARFPRRAAVGAAAAALGAVRPIRAAAAGATPAPETATACVMAFDATVRQGPSAGRRLWGALGLRVAADGAIDRGVLVGPDGELPVVGQAVGRAVHLLLRLPDGRQVFGVGTAGEHLASCPPLDADGRPTVAFDVGGPFVGPDPGDAGGWLAGQTQFQALNVNTEPDPEDQRLMVAWSVMAQDNVREP